MMKSLPAEQTYDGFAHISACGEMMYTIILEISLTFIQDLVFIFRVYPLGILGIRKCVRHQNVIKS
jgi:hypothetical protein